MQKFFNPLSRSSQQASLSWSKQTLTMSKCLMRMAKTSKGLPSTMLRRPPSSFNWLSRSSKHSSRNDILLNLQNLNKKYVFIVFNHKLLLGCWSLPVKDEKWEKFRLRICCSCCQAAEIIRENYSRKLFEKNFKDHCNDVSISAEAAARLRK